MSLWVCICVYPSFSDKGTLKNMSYYILIRFKKENEFHLIKLPLKMYVCIFIQNEKYFFLQKGTFKTNHNLTFLCCSEQCTLLFMSSNLFANFVCILHLESVWQVNSSVCSYSSTNIYVHLSTVILLKKIWYRMC